MVLAPLTAVNLNQSHLGSVAYKGQFLGHKGVLISEVPCIPRLLLNSLGK